MKFLSNILASVIGFFIAIFLIFIFFVGIAWVIGSSFSLEENNQQLIEIKSNSVLEIDLSSRITDYIPKTVNPFDEFINKQNKLGLNKILNAIDKAKTDDKIKGISIKTKAILTGITQVQTIRDKIKEFKSSGKFVYAYADFYTQKNYFLSSVADSVFLNPIGNIDFKGLSTEILYYKDFEEKFGVKIEVIRHGKYKSAVEPFLENKMSQANKEQTASFLTSIWSELTNAISESRNITNKKLNHIADNYLGRNAKLAKKENLIDQIIYEDEYDFKLHTITDNNDLKENNIITINDYIKSTSDTNFTLETDLIAVVYAQGNILYGEGDENAIGNISMLEMLNEIKDNDDVKAVVIRVNSPGGSALASEIIWRAVHNLKKVKPVVVSMGEYAASGGYYISSAANKIFANPTTTTGSIGVFKTLKNAYKLSEKIGINAEQVRTNKNIGYSVFEPMNKKFYEINKESVEETYQLFLKRVAIGRKISVDEVHKVAQGRIWSGKQAIAINLADELGGLEDAIKSAAEIANISSYDIKNYPKFKTSYSNPLKSIVFGKVNTNKIIKETLGQETYEIFLNLTQFKNQKGIQARIPYVLEIK